MMPISTPLHNASPSELFPNLKLFLLLCTLQSNQPGGSLRSVQLDINLPSEIGRICQCSRLNYFHAFELGCRSLFPHGCPAVGTEEQGDGHAGLVLGRE